MFSTNYLNKRSISFKSFQFPNINKKKYFSSILIIPSYKESNYIIETLNSLNNQNEFNLSELLVIIVVNNSISDPESVIEDNVKTINLIRKFNSNYSLEYINASTKGNALPSNLAGVGYSRKIGMDFSLKYSKEDTILHCLDADTIVSPDYFQTIRGIYKKKKINALITNFEHQLPIKNNQF